MSVVAKWIRVPCLKHITKLKLRYHVHSSQEALNRLLRQLEGIELRVPDHRTVAAFESAVRDGHGRGVKDLRTFSEIEPEEVWEADDEKEVPGARWKRGSFDTLWRAIELLPRLSDLHLDFGINRSNVDYGTLNAVLAGGACPALEGLVLDDLKFHNSKVELAAAFENRPKTCKRLLRLTLSGVNNEDDTREAVGRILLSHTCAELEQLHVTSGHKYKCDGVIATYLRRTGAPKLQEALFESAMLDETVQALNEGAQALTSLTLRDGFSEGSFLPVADAIRTRGAWDRLRVLQLEEYSSGDSILRSDLHELFGAIGGAHGCPNLRELAIYTRNGSVGAVASAIGMGAFRALESLRFFDYEGSAEEEEVAALGGALQRNPLASLRTLEIGCRFSYAPLFRAFRGGACVNLRRMYLHNGGTDLGELALVLKDGWGGHLCTLSFSASCDAIAPILEAVACSGVCPALKELESSIPSYLSDMYSKGKFKRVLLPKKPGHDAVVRNLATILSGGATCSSSLVKLSLNGWDIDPDDMRVLSRALSLVSSARISILHLTCMQRLGDAGVRHLMRAIQRGLGMWLREVDLTNSEYDRRVFTGFDCWCPHLEEVAGHEDITARAHQRRTRMLW